jgi:competence protein ComEC
MSEPGGVSSTRDKHSQTHRGGAFRGPSAASWLRRLWWRWSDVAGTLHATFERELEQRTGVRWLAVAFATGAATYFTLPREPIFVALALLTFLFAVAAVSGYHRGRTWRLATFLAILLAGAAVAKVRVDCLDGPQVEREVSAALSGRVVSSEGRAELRPRIVLDQLASPVFASARTPRRVRLTLAERYGLPPLGARISMRARLMPVGGPIVPGGYDPHRAAFLDGIGGSGFLLGGWKMEQPAPGFSADLAVARLRAAISARIIAAEPGQAGAVAATLLVGDRSGLSEVTKENLRIAGLAHILAISGLHMMLVAGTAFFVLRALFALSPRLALAFPIRKWAAVVALIVVTIYLALSGGGAATVRAYVMAAIIFAAILVDRPAISMRNLAIAAFVVVALAPESVMEPGFQMSFGAVVALIAVWEYWRDRQVARLADPDVLPGFRAIRSGWRAILGVALTTIVAGLATGPFAAYHFQRVASYSLLGNLLAAPLVSLVVMPFGLLALVAMPFGLEALPLAVMGRGIDALLAVAAWVASLPGAEVRAPHIAPLSLLLIVAGMLWLCLWRLRWRLLGLPVIALGLASIPFLVDPPDIMVAPDGKAVAVRDPSGVVRVSGARAGSYVVEQFFDEESDPPEDAKTLRGGTRCDSDACLLSAADGLTVSHVLAPIAFAEDCARATVIVTPLVAPTDCAAPLVVDATRLERYGAHAARIDSEDGAPAFRVTTSRSATPRPWQALR